MSQSRTITNLVLTIAFAAVCLAGIAYFAAGMGLNLPGQSGYPLNAIFESTNGLVPQSEVRISGVKVGHVLDVTTTAGGRTLVKMTMDSNVRVRSDSRAVIRPKSALGEKFVEIIREANSSSDFLSGGATIPMAQTGQSVELDDALSNMDPQTRAAMAKSFKELGAAVDGRATDINASIPEIKQTVTNLRPLAQIGQNRQKEIDRILTDLNTIMQSLADEHDALGQIVDSGDQAMSAIAARDTDLAGILQQLAVLFASLDKTFADLTPADRASLQKSPSTLQAQRRMLGLTGPNVDQLIPEILLGEVNYPNNELSVTHKESKQLALEWISNFWQSEVAPNQSSTGPHHALRIASSLDLFGVVLGALCNNPPPVVAQLCTQLKTSQSGSSSGPTTSSQKLATPKAPTIKSNKDVIDFLMQVHP